MGKAATKIEQVAQLSKQGLGVREIANAMGTEAINVHSLRYHAKKAGHDLPDLTKRITDDEHAEIARLRATGLTQRQIADVMGRSLDGVRRSLQMAGLLSAQNQVARPLEIKKGSIGKALQTADDAAFKWIMDQVPVGGNIAETIVEIALDQYFEKGANT